MRSIALIVLSSVCAVPAFATAAPAAGGDLMTRGWTDHVQNLQLHLKQVSREAADKTYNFTGKWFNQRVDHVNAQHQGRFWQRYFVYDKYSRTEQNYPLFVFCGAEQGDIYQEWDRYGFMVEVARKEGAKVLWLEHRFFGQSVPFGAEAFELRPDRVGLLSLDQSLADYAEIIRQYKGEGPVLTFGGSLSGTMAAMMRVRYPELVDMAYASSAPIIGVNGVADQFAWRKVVTDNFAMFGGNDCPDIVRRGFAALAAKDRKKLHQAFKPCEAETSDAHWDQVGALLWSNLEMLGTFVYPDGSWVVRPACDAMRGSGDASGEEAFARLLERAYPAEGECRNMTKLVSGGGEGAAWGMGWSYMACTECIHPIGANNKTDMFPAYNWTVAGLKAQCSQSWHVDPDPGYLMRKMGLRVDGIGSNASVHASSEVPGRVLLSWGEFDPWSTMIPRKGWAKDVKVVKIPGGSHCSDLQTPYAYDTDGMRAARLEMASIIHEWIAELRPIRRMDVNNFGSGGGKFGAAQSKPFGAAQTNLRVKRHI